MLRTEYETSSSRFEKCTKYSTGWMFIVAPSVALALDLDSRVARRRVAA
jgi:hypothetical protein